MAEQMSATPAPKKSGEAVVNISVCFATPTEQHLVQIAVPVETTIAHAVQQTFPNIDLSQHRVGIFGKLKTPETLVREHDRVEIYRPLLADPKDSRRRRAAHKA